MSRLESLVNSLLLKRTRVRAVEALGEHFRLIDLVGDDPAALKFQPGDKVQVRVAPWTMRTFTPLVNVTSDPAAAPAGSLRLLVFHHAATPAGAWVRALSTGDEVEFFGPRRSIPLETLSGPHALFGDETSVGVAQALHTCAGHHRSYLETDHPAELREVLERLQMHETTVVQRERADEHLGELAQQLRALAGALVFTGKAQSIQALRAHLGAEKRRIAKTKAYWSVGKVGLD